MDTGRVLANVGWAVGDPSRAAMLAALMSGQALTAGELAQEAGVTPSTASSHLAILSDRGFLTPVRQGRHRYYRLAGAGVAELLERMSHLAPVGPTPRGAASSALRLARTCYDHLAGELGVRVFDAMATDGRLVVGAGGIALSSQGRAFLVGLGIEAGEGDGHSLACRPCLDFTERRPHLAGRAAAALLTVLTDRRWLTPGPVRRSLRLTPAGGAAFDLYFRPAS
ncbi:helix-turn-helix transcriptional regulator [uncultured Brevundimonas sp.]|uniref:ArsR/SmtB family transcription factor n=1 Tax=uncultured Brevundimonas sp. TaxID=213418 RepID=UPI0030EB39BA|tara:strand:- start:61025 stop:61699 length:675 start_codon:yes stop_codon:yes gene_type:complete